MPEQGRLANVAAGGRIPIACADGRDFLASQDIRYYFVILNDVLEHFAR